MSSSNGCTIPHPPGCEAVLMSLTMTMEGPVLQTSRNGFFRKAMSSLKARGKTSPQMFALHRNTQAGEYGSLSDTGAISLPSVKPLFTCQGERPLLHFQAQAQPAVPILSHLWSGAGSLHISGGCLLSMRKTDINAGHIFIVVRGYNGLGSKHDGQLAYKPKENQEPGRRDSR